MDGSGAPVGMIAPIGRGDPAGSRVEQFEEDAMAYATEANLPDLALERWEACHSSRLREIMQSLVKHLHSFVHEVGLKEDEWLTAMNWLAKTGGLSTEKGAEFLLFLSAVRLSHRGGGV